MISDSNDELTSPASSSRKRKPASAKSNLEFDFGNGSRKQPQNPAPSATVSVASEKPKTYQSASSSTPGTAQADDASNAQSKPYTTYSRPHAAGTSSPSPMSTTPSPTFSQFQQNVARQSREQRAVGSLLSGVAIAIIMAILLVAGLAAYGGYILSQQIKQQSATVAQLDAKTTANFDLLSRGLKDTATAVDGLNTQIQAQKQLIQSLQSQLESVRSQAGKDRASLDSRFKKLDVRLLDVEREVLKR